MPSSSELVTSYNDQETLPHVVIRVNHLIASKTSSIQDFEEIIGLDPVLVARLLRLVNSSYFGLRTKIESIGRAVAYIGMKGLRNLVAVEAIKDQFRDKGQGFSRNDLWQHSATVAILAQMIAVRIFGLKGDDIFLAGILHDIGLIVEDQGAGELLRQAAAAYMSGNKPFPVYEREVIGTDHCKVGALLTDGWNISTEVFDAIRLHHSDIGKQPASGVSSILQLANFFAGRTGYSWLPGRISPLPSPALVEHVQKMMPDYRVIISALPKEIDKAKELYNLNG